MATTTSGTTLTETLTDTISSANAVLERTIQNAIDMAKSANSAFRRHDDVAVALRSTAARRLADIEASWSGHGVLTDGT